MNNISAPPTLRGEQAKSQLIQAAIEQFGEHGLRATTRDIAARAGQNIAAIAYYFGSKEALYIACARWISDFFNQHFQQHVANAQALIDANSHDKAAIRSVIHSGCALMTTLLTNDDTLHMSKFVSREQLSPTEAYNIIHQHMISPMHEHFCRLIARYTGRSSEDTETILHAHGLVGCIVGFRLARETVLKRCGWSEFNAARTELIEKVITQQVDFILQGLSTSRGDVNHENP